MSAGVLFDAAGPRTRRRHLLYSVVSTVVLLAVIAWAVLRLNDKGQLEYALWEPFVTPKYVAAIGEAWLQTLQMAGLAVLGAVVLGLLLGTGKLSDLTPVRWVSWVVVEFFRALPVIMLMIFCFYAVFGSIDEIDRAAYWTCVLALALYNGSVIAEIVRAGVLALPKGQSEAAYAIGLTKSQTMSIILLPQAIKIMIPAMISQCVVAVKDTSLILIVAPIGLTKVAKQLPLEFNNLVPTVFVVALLYIITNLVLTGIAQFLQRRLVGEKQVLQVAHPGAQGEAFDGVL